MINIITMRIHELTQESILSKAVQVGSKALGPVTKTGTLKSIKPFMEMTDKFSFIIGFNTIHISQVAKDPAAAQQLAKMLAHLRTAPAINGMPFAVFMRDHAHTAAIKKPQVIQGILSYMRNSIKFMEPVFQQNLNPSHPRASTILKNLDDLKQLYRDNVAYWK
jgi:hypothetical protein